MNNQHLFTRIDNALKEGAVIKARRKLDHSGIPFHSYRFLYQMPKDRLSVGTLLILFYVDQWAAHKALCSLPSIEYAAYHKESNGAEIAFNTYA